jgi:hypothetical protein
MTERERNDVDPCWIEAQVVDEVVTSRVARHDNPPRAPRRCWYEESHAEGPQPEVRLGMPQIVQVVNCHNASDAPLSRSRGCQAVNDVDPCSSGSTRDVNLIREDPLNASLRINRNHNDATEGTPGMVSSCRTRQQQRKRQVLSSGKGLGEAASVEIEAAMGSRCEKCKIESNVHRRQQIMSRRGSSAPARPLRETPLG